MPGLNVALPEPEVHVSNVVAKAGVAPATRVPPVIAATANATLNGLNARNCTYPPHVGTKGLSFVSSLLAGSWSVHGDHATATTPSGDTFSRNRRRGQQFGRG
jgi:hypothetical protein